MKKVAFLCKILLIISLMFNSTFGFAISKKKSVYPLDKAVSVGVDNSFKLLNADIKIIEKQKALKQAQKGSQYSGLVLLRLFEKKATFNKEYGKDTKGQLARNAYSMAKVERVYKEVVERYKIKDLYLIAYNSKILVEKKEQIYKEELEKLNLGMIQLKNKQIELSDFQEQEKTVKKAKKSRDDQKEKADATIVKLGEYIDADLSNYTVHYNYQKAYLSKSVLPGLIEKGIDESFNIYSMKKNIDQNLYLLQVITKLYTKDFGGSRLAGMKNLIGSNDVETIEALNPKTVVVTYENLVSALISRWGDDWKPYYKISLIFFSIKIPKLFRFGEFDGVRYLEDARYIQMIKILETKQLIADEIEAEKTLAEVITNLFTDINNKTYDLEVNKEEFKTLQKEYEILQLKFKNKEVEAKDVVDKKSAIDTLDIDMAKAQFDISQQILELDKQTNGEYSKLVKAAALSGKNLKPSPFPRPKVEELLEEIEEKKKEEELAQVAQGANNGITWSLEAIAKDVTDKFSLDLGDASYETYRLFSAEGGPISERQNVGESFKHLHIILSDIDNLRVYFYGAEDEIFKYKLVGSGEQGTLEFVEKIGSGE